MNIEQTLLVLEEAKNNWEYHAAGKEKMNKESFRLEYGEDIHEIVVSRLIPLHNKDDYVSKGSDVTIGWRVHYNYYSAESGDWVKATPINFRGCDSVVTDSPYFQALNLVADLIIQVERMKGSVNNK